AFLITLVIFTSSLAAYVLIQPYQGPFHLGGLVPISTEDMEGPFQNRNTYASLVELALPVALWRGMRARGAAWPWWVASGLMAASVVSAASRAGSTLVFVELLAVPLFARMSRLISGRSFRFAFLQMLGAAAAGI